MSQKKLRKIRKNLNEKIKEEVNPVGKGLSFWKIIVENWVFVALLLLGTVLLYLNGMNGNFVSDDYATIPQFPEVTNLAIQSQQLSLPTWSNWLIASLFGNLESAPYHIFSLGLYLAILLVAFVLVYLLFGRKLAMITSLIFAAMPIHVEGVTWISGKPYSFNTLFVVWAMVISILYLKTKRKFYAYFLIGLLPWVFFADKVRSFSYIFLMVLTWISFPSLFRIKINWGKILLVISLVIIPGIIFILPKIGERINTVNSGYNSSESVFYNPFFQYPTSVTKYMQLMWLPVDLTLYHTMYTFPVWLNWAILLTFLAAIGYFFFKNKNIFFALTFIFLAASPSMAPVKVSWLVAERYMFLGSLGFALFLAMVINDFWPKLKIVAPVFLACYVIFGMIKSFIRNDEWTTNHKLWVSTCQVSPNSHNAWNNIGDDYDKLKEYDNAVKGFTQSVVVKPNYADAYHNRANIFFKTGRLDLARESYNIALSFSPTLFQTYLSLTQIDLMEKKLDLALAHASKAVELQPDNPQNLYVLGVVYVNAGNADQARKIFTTIIQRYPGYKLAQDALKEVEAINSRT